MRPPNRTLACQLAPALGPRRARPVKPKCRFYSASVVVMRPVDNDPVATHTTDIGLGRSLRDLRSILVEDIGGPGEWQQRVDVIIQDLQRRRSPAIGVYGDAFAAPEDLVSALLQDPLLDLDGSSSSIMERRNGRLDGPLRITSGGSDDHDGLDVQSSWLAETGFAVVESPSKVEIVDLAIVVTDPYRLHIPEGISGYRLVVVNGPLPPHTTPDIIRQRLASDSPVVFVRSDLALNAIETLSRSAHLPATSRERVDAVAVFQRDFLLSGIGELKDILKRTVPTRGPFQEVTAQTIAEGALSYAQDVIRQDRDTIRSVGKVISELERKSKQAVSRARHVSAVNRGIDGGVVEGGVQHALSQAKAGLSTLLEGRFSWLGLLGRARADDVSLELTGFVESNFGRDLESTLVFESGQMAQLQEQLNTETDRVVRKLSDMGTNHPFASKMLQNHLASLTLSTPTFAPDSLLQPIRTRRRQIQLECIPRLHRSAQRSILTAFSTGFAGALASVLVYPSIPGATAAGLGMLSVIGGIILGQRVWYRAQRRFIRDLDRITGMLQGDLQAILEDALEARLLGKPTAAVEGLIELKKSREEKLDQLEMKLDEVRRTLA